MKRQLFIHHSAIATNGPQFHTINVAHKNRDFPLSNMGYHGGYQYLIERDAEIKQYRTEEERGAHTLVTGKDYNLTGIAICIAGDFTQQDPTDGQIAAFLQLAKEIMERWDIRIEDVYEHRDVKATACPGWNFRYALEAHLKASGSFLYARSVWDTQSHMKRLQRAVMRSQSKVRLSLQKQLSRFRKRT